MVISMGSVPIRNGKVPNELQTPTLIWVLGLFLTRISGIIRLFNVWAYGGAVLLIMMGIKLLKNKRKK